jgi:hypothetical protein
MKVSLQGNKHHGNLFCVTLYLFKTSHHLLGSRWGWLSSMFLLWFLVLTSLLAIGEKPDPHQPDQAFICL